MIDRHPLFLYSIFSFPFSLSHFLISYFLFPISYFLFSLSHFLFPIFSILFPLSYLPFPLSSILYPLSLLVSRCWFFHSMFDVGRSMFDVHLFYFLFPLFSILYSLSYPPIRPDNVPLPWGCPKARRPTPLKRFHLSRARRSNGPLS